MDKEILLTRLGARIRELRIQQGLTQVQLAHSIGKDQQSIQKVEMGDFNPSYIYLFEIAGGLGITIDELLRFDHQGL